MPPLVFIPWSLFPYPCNQNCWSILQYRIILCQAPYYLLLYTMRFEWSCQNSCNNNCNIINNSWRKHKEIMTMKEVVYLLQNPADLHKLLLQFFHHISFLSLRLLTNTNVYTCITSYISARVCISYTTRMLMLYRYILHVLQIIVNTF